MLATRNWPMESIMEWQFSFLSLNLYSYLRILARSTFCPWKYSSSSNYCGFVGELQVSTPKNDPLVISFMSAPFCQWPLRSCHWLLVCALRQHWFCLVETQMPVRYLQMNDMHYDLIDLHLKKPVDINLKTALVRRHGTMCSLVPRVSRPSWFKLKNVSLSS